VRQRIGLLGLPDPALASPCHRIACAVFRTVSVRRFCNRLHPLVRLATPAESLEPNRPGADVRAAFLGLPSLIAASSVGVHVTRASQAHAVPSSTFLTSSTGYSSIRLCGFISPRSHVQGSLFRGFP
jgi:hypothetical protein